MKKLIRIRRKIKDITDTLFGVTAGDVFAIIVFAGIVAIVFLIIWYVKSI